MAIHWRRWDNLAVVTIDNPPVNALGQAERQGLLEAVRRAEAERLDRVIVTGAGRAFAAGGDAREFDGPPLPPQLPDVLDAIETSFVPWVAALNGLTLGGGLEIALACRQRIAAPGIQLGLPEVTLGVIPGAGGTQRLPRLIGLAPAVDLITSGKPISAERALALGLVDALDDLPLDAAYLINSEELGCRVPLGELPAPSADFAADPALFDRARQGLDKRQPGQLAPRAALEVIEQGLARPFEAALVAERERFLALRSGPQSRALRHLFFAERAAKAPADLPPPARPLRRVLVAGGGLMGSGISAALLAAGLSVTLLEVDAAGCARAEANIGRIIADSQARGLVDAVGAADRRSRLTLTCDVAAAAEADLAIEAAFESPEVKGPLLAQLEAALPADAVLASNTSYLDLDALAAGLADPSRLIGLHFFAPAHIMKLLEIVRGARSQPQALATGFALAKLLRKVPVLAGVCDGFIGNRILARYREAADTVLLEASTPWDIDEAMVAFGYAMGPYEAQDLSGLDIAHAHRQRQAATRDPARRVIPIADRMVELGKLGRKTGAGWYRYPGGGGKVEDPIVADLALEEAHFAGIKRREMTADEIQQRLLLAMVNEAADILAEGIAARASDIDLVTAFGYGFPRWRGGLLHWADSLGVAAIIARLEVFAQEDPIAWRVSPALRRCLAEGWTLADYRAA